MLKPNHLRALTTPVYLFSLSSPRVFTEPRSQRNNHFQPFTLCSLRSSDQAEESLNLLDDLVFLRGPSKSLENNTKKIAKILPDNSNDLIKTCRICYNDDQNQLISPCKCTGTSKYVHKDCLVQWISVKYTSHKHASCEICKHPFKFCVRIKRKFNPSEGLKQNLGACCMAITLSAIIVMLSCILGYLIAFNLDFEDNKKTSFLILAIFLLLITIGIIVILRSLKKVFFIPISKDLSIINFENKN